MPYQETAQTQNLHLREIRDKAYKLTQKKNVAEKVQILLTAFGTTRTTKIKKIIDSYLLVGI